LQNKIKELTTKMKQILTKELSKKQELNEALQNERVTKEELEKMAQDSEQGKRMLEQLVETLQQQLKGAEEFMTEKISHLESQLQEANSQLDSLQGDLVEAHTDKAQLTTDLQDMQEASAKQAGIMKTHMDLLEAHEKGLRGDMKNLQSELDRIKQELEEAQKLIEELMVERNKLDGVLDTVVRKGWLRKKSPNETLGKKFQTRYFVLKGVTLCYYKSDKDDLSHPKGTIQLDHCQVLQLSTQDAQEKTGTNIAFELRQFSNNRVYTFVAQDGQDLKAWVETMTRVKLIHHSRTEWQKKLGEKLGSNNKS